MPDKKQHATPCMSVEGFDSIVAYAHERQMVNHVRGMQVVDAWLEYPSAEGGQIVEWNTAPAPETTGLIAFSWTCLLGGGQVSCNHHLFLNGSELLCFQTPICRRHVWRGESCVLRFDSVAIAQNGESYGVMTLTVSATRLHFGVPARIKVVGGVVAVSNFSFLRFWNSAFPRVVARLFSMR